MRLSVVMSVRNAERYVRQAVRSVLDQTFAEFEFIVVDDSSTDGTAAILERLATMDSRISIVHHSGPGNYAAARTVGIKQASNEWVALMDADDICHPKRFERQVAVIETHGEVLGALGTWGRYIDEHGNVVGAKRTGPTTLEEFQQRYEARDSLALLDPSSVLHRPSFLAVGGYRPEAAPAADLDLWYRIAELGRPVLALPETLLDYRVHSSSVSSAKHLLQRRKAHYINYNMRRRRDGHAEVDWVSFERDVWGKLIYRLPRLRRDVGFVFFRRAAMAFVAGRYARRRCRSAARFPVEPTARNQALGGTILAARSKSLKYVIGTSEGLPVACCDGMGAGHGRRRVMGS